MEQKLGSRPEEFHLAQLPRPSSQVPPDQTGQVRREDQKEEEGPKNEEVSGATHPCARVSRSIRLLRQQSQSQGGRWAQKARRLG